MHWVTIYDINDEHIIWHLTVTSVLIVGFNALLLPDIMGMVPSPGQQATTKKTAGEMTLRSLIAALALIISIGWLYSQWHDRWDDALGYALKVDGPVEEVRVEVTPRASIVYFQVGNDWFKLPYSHPSTCYPREGQAVALDATETAALIHQGPPAHAIYRLRLADGCGGTQPNPPEPYKPA